MIGKYLAFIPEERGSIGEEWRQCLKQIIYTREPGFSLIKINVFTDIHDDHTHIKVYREIGKSILNAFGKQCPTFNITIHPPEKPWKVAVEAAYTTADSSEITRNIGNSIPYVVCTTESGKEVWAGGLGSVFFP